MRSAVATQPASREPADRYIAASEADRGNRRRLRVNRDEGAHDRNEEQTRADECHKWQEHAEHRAAHLAGDTADHLAAAATDVNAIGLVERSPIYLPAEVGTGTERESRAGPGKQHADRSGDDRCKSKRDRQRQHQLIRRRDTPGPGQIRDSAMFEYHVRRREHPDERHHGAETYHLSDDADHHQSQQQHELPLTAWIQVAP